MNGIAAVAREVRPVDEHERAVIGVCERAVGRLTRALPEREVACLLRFEDVLRHVAHSGRLRFIYEVPREWGGIVWRAVDQGTPQLVEDVSADPDYLASDEAIRSEVVVPLLLREEVIGVLDVESTVRLREEDAKAVEKEAKRLARELGRLFASTSGS